MENYMQVRGCGLISVFKEFFQVQKGGKVSKIVEEYLDQVFESKY